MKATRPEQAALIAAAPETSGVPAYVGRHGWVSIQLATVDPTELGELVVEAWRQTAPRRLVAAYDAGWDAQHVGRDAQDAGRDAHDSGIWHPWAVTGAEAVRGRGSMRAWLLDLARFR